MSLVFDSVRDSFSFFRRNLSLILYQLIFLLTYAAIVIVFLFAFLGYRFSSLSSLTSVGFFSSTLSISIILGIFAIVQSAGYPILVKQSKAGKVDIIDAFKTSFKSVHRVIITSIIQVLPSLLIFIPYFLLLLFLSRPSNPPSGNFIFLVALTLFLLTMSPVAIYFSVRLWFSIPVLMIERRGIIESAKRGWRLTKGKFWSIFATILLFSLVIFGIEGIFLVPVVFGPTTLSISLIAFFIVAYFSLFPVANSLPSVYYYNLNQPRQRAKVK